MLAVGAEQHQERMQKAEAEVAALREALGELEKIYEIDRVEHSTAREIEGIFDEHL